MDPNQTAAEFQTTHWAMVYRARGNRAGLEQLLRLYWSPVYGFIRKQGYGGHDASDLTQEFLAQVVIGRDIVGRADPSRGRFRAFLKQALRNFLIDQHRTHRHSKGGRSVVESGPGRTGAGPIQTIDLDAIERRGALRPPAADTAASDPEWGDGAGREFDREWAATIVHITLQRLEDQARAEGLAAHWTAFRANILGPALWRTSPIPLGVLAERVGAADADQVSNMIQTIKRKFRRTLREVVGETLATPDQIEEELAALREYFSSGGNAGGPAGGSG